MKKHRNKAEITMQKETNLIQEEYPTSVFNIPSSVWNSYCIRECMYKLVLTFLLNFTYRANAREDSIMTELGRCHGAHNPVQHSLQITMTTNMPRGTNYNVVVIKDSEAKQFHVERIFRQNYYLEKIMSDLSCPKR